MKSNCCSGPDEWRISLNSLIRIYPAHNEDACLGAYPLTDNGYVVNFYSIP